MNCKCVLFCQQLSKTLCAKALRLTETECVGVRRSAGAEVYRVLAFLQFQPAVDDWHWKESGLWQK